jgi:hypothetical protein
VQTNNQYLRAIHAQACAAVARANKRLTPEVDAFWPLYIAAVLAAHPADVQAVLTDAARDVLAERTRHSSVEGWTTEHDDEHGPGALALAAAAYALDAGKVLDLLSPVDAGDRHEPIFWPFSSHWWKPGEPRRGLVKAASLILAEIERMDRDPGDESGHHRTRGGDDA